MVENYNDVRLDIILLNNANVKLIEGRGKVIDPHTIDVDGKIYTSRNILIAVGGHPFIPDIPGREYAIDFPSNAKKIAIVGGGYIALEFAGIFNGLNIEVHVFIRQKKVMREPHVMFATGRKPNTKYDFDHWCNVWCYKHNLGLENVGVKLAKTGAIEV
ncbi:unnamed protein product [Brassica napus]|uniref:(rape) hypothetical protein n=1 Tax=Brassica napus TaxID=3708 RepID=A0A816IEH7_BRANA|nr:unnamed protein product [Brassica napus]